MARFSYEERIVTKRSLEECLEASRRSLAVLGAGPELVGARDLVGRMGSRLFTRLFGGIWISNEKLPVQIRVRADDRGEQRELLITVEESIGFGTIAGMERKYRFRCQQVAAQVREACVQGLEGR